MVLSAQAQRNWRLAAWVGSALAGIQCVFLSEYNLPVRPGDDEGHVFTPVQQWYQQKRNEFFGGQQQLPQQRDAVGGDSPCSTSSSSSDETRKT